MTQLYLVRHGETAWSRVGRRTSVTDLDLTDLGQAQARALRGPLDPADFGLVWCSPRRRARRTAQLAGFDPAADQVRTRVSRVIERAESSGVDRVLCFAHAHVLRALTLVWLDLDLGHGEAFPDGHGHHQRGRSARAASR